MTRTRKSLAVAAITMAALGAAAAPALADHHIPSPPNSVTAQDSHAPVTPLDNHMPVASKGGHAGLSPMDNHMP
ncbi:MULTISPECIES: hypothetical protein [unclassified Streptomyces]|uniref:hypothetical protein n=1 Tax=unclassified Streptomyces TaxID=2593676 RepID=UPI00035C36D4|nr:MULTISPECIES: hypothetical protein [unclassified Streptomyces]MYT31071.1 hypothetical protein [Streptomyces sp. SID8354]